MPLLGLQCRLNRHRLYGTKNLLGDRRVDARAAEGQASRQPQHQVGTVAPIDGPGLPPARIDNRYAPSTSPARQQPREQRPSASAGLGAADSPVGIGRELPLVAFKLRPIDVAFMMILQQNLAGLKRFTVAVGLAQTSVDDRGALLAFAVSIGACIKRVLEHRDHIAVTDRQPFEGDQLLAIGGSREVDLILGHRQQDLTRAAQLAKAGEDQTDAFLDPSIGIKTKAELAMTDQAA